MLKCRLNRHFIDRAVTRRSASVVLKDNPITQKLTVLTLLTRRGKVTVSDPVD